MLDVKIPGHKTMNLGHLVVDYNGTIACDGRILDGVKERLETLAQLVEVHVLTADTFGSVRRELSDMPCQLAVIPVDDQAEAKRRYIRQLGVEHCVCVGNGRNDRLMLDAAALGIAVFQTEGAAVEAMLAADVAVPNILDALDLLLHPLRLAATLRS
ncbi:MAG TPA: ATPase P [Syntrophobacteraceae bacterium]|jgi:soluble P-type ATPase|nr:ATPase P [Syntrophobacteraceae bacterium]HBZ55785.1 ATPase P [Syntrophobacteraceae bacterium]